MGHQDTRSENMASAQAGKFNRTEERDYAKDYLNRQHKDFKDRGVFKDRKSTGHAPT